MKDSAIGARIRTRIDQEREAKGLDEAQMLRMAGITAYRFRVAMAADRGPRLKDLCSLADVLEQDVSKLLHDERGAIWEERGLDIGQVLRKNVEAACKQKGWSHEDLAREMGLPPSRLADALSASNPGLRTMRDVALVLDTTLDDLLEDNSDNH